MWRELRAAAAREVVLPQIIGERCVHALMEQAKCRACADACPTQAWVIDDDTLGIDATRCDGCDLCVPACPQAVITHRFAPAVKITEAGAMAFAACEHSGVRDINDGLMPCLHAVGLSDLLRLYQEGVTHLDVSSGDCDRCSRGGGGSLEGRVTEVNRLLTSRGAEPLAYRTLEPAVWIEAAHRVDERAGGRALSRRAFFRSAFEAPRERVEAVFQEIAGAFSPPGTRLPEGPPEALFPYVPVIEPERCSGCDACARLCPHGAIALAGEASRGLAYRIDPRYCTNCHLCVDVCEERAVEVRVGSTLPRERVPLHRGRCRACGVAFHLPVVGGEARSLCRICRRTNHYRSLYQVLD